MKVFCIPSDDGKCLLCNYQVRAGVSFPKRYCPKSPDLLPAAANLGLTLDETVNFHQQLAAWQAVCYPERSEAERAAIAATPCESRREDGVCSACGCNNGVKTIRCDLLARLATENCPKGHFGDQRAAIKAEIAKAVEANP